MLLGFTACRPDDVLSPADTGGDTTLPDPPTPVDVEVSELGRLLFYDPILSGNRDVACATCHHPDFGYADGRALSLGIDATGLGPNRRPNDPNNVIGFVSRNSPTVLNTAFNGIDEDRQVDPAAAPMFWDSRARSLEAQALLPLESFEEMRGHAFGLDLAVDSIVARLRQNEVYAGLFAGAFGGNVPVSASNLATAIAEFERTLTARNSPFDRFMAGDLQAMSQAAQAGLERFNQVGCNDCHNGPMFSDFELHVIGVPEHPLLDAPDEGAEGRFAFRTPTLRNLGETGPYFHNGVGGSLQATVDFYRRVRGNGGGNNGDGLQLNTNVNRNDLDADIRDLGNLNGNAVDEIVAFLQALDDPDFDRTIPAEVPSGLPVGGR